MSCPRTEHSTCKHLKQRLSKPGHAEGWSGQPKYCFEYTMLCQPCSSFDFLSLYFSSLDDFRLDSCDIYRSIMPFMIKSSSLCSVFSLNTCRSARQAFDGSDLKSLCVNFNRRQNRSRQVNKPRSTYQYSNMAQRLSGQNWGLPRCKNL